MYIFIYTDNSVDCSYHGDEPSETTQRAYHQIIIIATILVVVAVVVIMVVLPYLYCRYVKGSPDLERVDKENIIMKTLL